MNFDKIISELYKLLKKPPEDAAAKSRLVFLTQSVVKNGLPDSGSFNRFLDELQTIHDFTVDRDIAEKLQILINTLSSRGITA